MRHATEINEIIGRGRTKNAVAMKRNRVPMCHSDHSNYHHGGVTKEKIEWLTKLAENRLKEFGESLENW